MATAVIMPRQGQSVESCVIGEWFKKVGDDVGEGELLFSYETDKAVFEEAAKVSGKLLAVFFGVGDDVPCLETVAVIGAEGDDINGVAPKAEAEPEQREEAPAEAAAPAAALQTAERARGISPRAKNAAERLRLDPAMAAPTGPNGRVIERDIAALAAESRTGSGLGGRLLPCDMETAKRQVEELTPAAPAAEYEDVRLTNIRKVIAKSMHQSLSEMAQLTHTVSFDATCIMNYRKQLKLAAEKLDVPNITLNDIMLYAVSRVLLHHHDLNAHYLGDSIRRFHHVNLGVAVDTPRGLMVPTLFNADEKSLREISSEAKALIAACQEGSINPDLLQGGSFTVSNLGSLGIEHFTPVINPPQTGILGVCGITERVRTGKDGGISVYPAMGLSLTYDHRALDGAPASRFLAELKTALESFTALLIG